MEVFATGAEGSGRAEKNPPERVFIATMTTQLLYRQVIFHRDDSGNPSCDFTGFGGALCRIDKTAQLNDPLEGLDTDLQRFQRRFLKDSGFYLGGDDGVIDKLSGARALWRGCAPQECGNQPDIDQKSEDALQFCHDALSFPAGMIFSLKLR
jgi:hypothetical protein